MKESTAASLTDLGLSNYEAQAYLALLTEGPATASAVATGTDIPQGRVYDALNALVDQSLVRADDGRPQTYSAVPPATAIDRLLDTQLSELTRRRNRLEATGDQLKTTLAELETEADTGSFATSAVGADAAQDLLLERSQSASDSIVIVAGAVDLAPAFEQAVAEQLESLLRAGVDVRVVVSSPRRPETTPESHITSLFEAGLSIRRTEQPPQQRYLVIDDVEVCLEVVHPISGENLLALINFRDDTLAAELAERFRGMWEAGGPWPPSSQ